MKSNKSLSEYNKEHSKVSKAVQSEGMKPAIDFSSTQRSKYAETGSTASSNGQIPSQGQSAQTKGFFKQ